MRRLFCFILLGLASAWPGAPRAATIEPLDQTVCRLIEARRRANRLPVEFLTRLIWRESSFRAGAVSPAGARGIAQFMPGTAQERGLADPFDPEQAIPNAAHLLAELRRRFGNLGIAAAAYNAGPARVEPSGCRAPADCRPKPAPMSALSRAARSRPGPGRTAAPKTVPGGEPERMPEPQSCLAAVADLRGQRRGRRRRLRAARAVGRAARRQFLEGDRAGLVRAGARRYAGVIGDMRPMIIGRVLRSRGTRKFYQVRLPAGDARGGERCAAASSRSAAPACRYEAD